MNPCTIQDSKYILYIASLVLDLNSTLDLFLAKLIGGNKKGFLETGRAAFVLTRNETVGRD